MNTRRAVALALVGWYLMVQAPARSSPLLPLRSIRSGVLLCPHHRHRQTLSTTLETGLY